MLPRSGGALRTAVLLMFALGAVGFAVRLVDFATASGLVNEEARLKNQTQARAGSLLLGGRPEIQVSSKAVLESPILGHGSWPEDPKYVEMLFDIEVERGVFDSSDINELSSDLIPTHSHLMGAWVWAGILGAAFWFYILWLTARATVRIANVRPPLAPIYVWIVSGMFWEIMFSPFGLNARIYDAVAIIIMVDLLGPEQAHIQKALTVMQRRITINRPRSLSNSSVFPTSQ